ncbi:MAG: methyltransferase domain-containing protein [Geobacter sp.]|nr:methyltransferase domain-containing protein [Geobacter sp.]
MEKDRIKWNGRYAGEGFFLGPNPSRLLEERIEAVEALLPGRRALDIACGEGRNSIFLARRGFSVTGIDISEEGLEKARRWATAEGVDIRFIRADLERYEFNEKYDLILNFNFLLRDLIPKMVAALNPGGVIFFDTILDTPTLVGHHNKAFLLQPGELRALFEPLPGETLFYEEFPAGPNPTAKLIFWKNEV